MENSFRLGTRLKMLGCVSKASILEPRANGRERGRRTGGGGGLLFLEEFI